MKSWYVLNAAYPAMLARLLAPGNMEASAMSGFTLRASQFFVGNVRVLRVLRYVTPALWNGGMEKSSCTRKSAPVANFAF